MDLRIPAKDVRVWVVRQLEVDVAFGVRVVAGNDLRFDEQVEELADVGGVCDDLGIRAEGEGQCFRGSLGERRQNSHMLIAKRFLKIAAKDELPDGNHSCEYEEGDENGANIQRGETPSWLQHSPSMGPTDPPDASAGGLTASRFAEHPCGGAVWP